MIYMLQWCSATVATIFLRFLGESVDQDGTVLQLQNVRLDVQPQCCGLNANLALLATAIVAAMLFLHRPVPRMILILAAVPLGIIRNGLRICVVAMLCEHIDPRMIHSWVHTQGAPVFFLRLGGIQGMGRLKVYDCEGSAQFVAGVSGELTLALEGRFEAV